MSNFKILRYRFARFIDSVDESIDYSLLDLMKVSCNRTRAGSKRGNS